MQDLNRALEHTEEQIAQDEKLAAIGHLAHGIAHELNTPLGVIISNLSVLRQYGDSLADFAAVAQRAAESLEHGEAPFQVAARLRAAAKTADLAFVLEDLAGLSTDSAASAQRMAAIVRSVATFAQRSTDQLEPINIEEAMQAAATLASNELKHRGQLVKLFAGVPRVMGQLGEMTQVFVHLLLNAAQALEGVQQANDTLGRGMLAMVRLLQTFLGWRLPERATQCKDVARLAGRLAELAGLSAEDARRIQVAALVHDIGLVRLPDHLLRRAATDLTLASRVQYQQHPIVGGLLLSAVEPLADMAKWIRSHHERWDGKGYPDRLAGATIHLGSRIIAVADGYRQALSDEGGTAPRWRSFQQDAGMYDPGLLVLLNDET